MRIITGALAGAIMLVTFGAPAQAYMATQGECFRAPCPVATTIPVRTLPTVHHPRHRGWSHWMWMWTGR